MFTGRKRARAWWWERAILQLVGVEAVKVKVVVVFVPDLNMQSAASTQLAVLFSDSVIADPTLGSIWFQGIR